MNINQQYNLHASILDRLVDHDPGVSSEPVQHRFLDIRQIKASVIRDLENLLNTRRNILSPGPEYHQLNSSLFVYGLGDFTAKNPRSPSVHNRLRTDVEKAIARFEPRLKNVKVQIDVEGDKQSNVRFHINALLVVEPEVEPVSFDTYFDTNRGEYVISR